ncbi:protein of unknown function [Microbacterium sp. Nx66]|nr:protein of unknown function [Microbacterium sp. Nx66]
MWRAVEPELVCLAADESRFDGVTTLGVDEHVWHHVDPRKRGPKELTGMVDLTRDEHGRVRARLLDLVPGRSGKAYATWLGERGDAFRKTWRWRRWIPSPDTRPRSTTSWKTLSRCSTRSMS